MANHIQWPRHDPLVTWQFNLRVFRTWERLHLGWMPCRKAYPSDVSDAEWALVAPCPTPPPDGGSQRTPPSREMFNGPRYLVRHGVAW